MTTCPSCHSTNVDAGWMGTVLHCRDCNWFYLNQFPCDICGKPSTWCVGIIGGWQYGCDQHQDHAKGEFFIHSRELS